MKNRLLLVVLVLIPFALSGQLIKSGNLVSETWNQNVQITADATIGNGVTIIILPGITVQLYSGVSLKVIGSGTLSADASSGSSITFTAYNGISWGHLVFTNTSASANSVLKNCIIEKGDASGLGVLNNYGGGISIKSDKITIENCTIRNNKAVIGGGIDIDVGFNPSLTNCLITSNTVTQGGGGVHIYAQSTAVLTNCIITGNSISEASDTYGGGGIMFGYNCYSAKVINCTFANNISKYGSDVSLYGSNSLPTLTNCILWSSNPVYYFNQSRASTDFNYCAIRGYVSGYTNCITLNSNNTASDGPNFYQTDGTNWAITIASPCLEAGTIPNPAVPYDIIGNSRILNYDIGAYEAQYSRWKTNPSSTAWNTLANWDGGLPSGSSDVLIPAGASDYPTDSPGPAFTIGSGKQMILKAGAKATISTLTNNGTLKLESDPSNISSLIVGSYSGNGATVELYLTGGQAGSKNYRWHYISTPVSTLPVNTFTTVTPDIVRFYDSRVTTDLVQGWVAQDGWIYSTGTFGGPTFTTLTPGLGYDYYDSNNNKFTFTGQLNTLDVPMTLEYSGGSKNGFNLLGNPFPSGLDWNYIITHRFPSGTHKALYFTRNNALCSYISGVGSPVDVNGYIPPMQGFFVKTYTAGKTIYLADSARTHTMHSRYKGSEIIPLIRLSLSDDTLSDETVVRFDEKASADFDYDFDALKIFYSTDQTVIYTGTNDVKYVINGQPFPETIAEIPVGINLLTSGNHVISTTQLQGLDNYDVFLFDNVTGFTSNLKTNPVLTFTASAGTIFGRFILKFANASTGIENPAVSQQVFNIYQGFNHINVQPLSDEWDGLQGSVSIFDMTGRKVGELRNTEFVKNSIISLPTSGREGIYLVELKSGMKRYTEKVVIK